MTRTELLLTQLAEECSEVAQRASKAVRFGLTEIQQGQEFTNAARIRHELIDLMTVYDMLEEAGELPRLYGEDYPFRDEAKRIKIDEHLALSAKLGILTPT